MSGSTTTTNQRPLDLTNVGLILTSPNGLSYVPSLGGNSVGDSTTVIRREVRPALTFLKYKLYASDTNSGTESARRGSCVFCVFSAWSWVLGWLAWACWTWPCFLASMANLLGAHPLPFRRERWTGGYPPIRSTLRCPVTNPIKTKNPHRAKCPAPPLTSPLPLPVSPIPLALLPS
jgi:hypothetical protein